MAGRKLGKALRPRFRVICGKDIALGPGKVELLKAVAEVGSLNEAAKRLGMSYMRAWMLAKTMNRCFREPVMVAERGGKRGGGMRVTETGRRALNIYDEIEAEALASTRDSWRRLQRLLRP